MIIQLQFSEIMDCSNLFQRFLTLAVYCASTPSILLTRVHNVTWLVHKWSFINTCAICVICYVLKCIFSSILHFSSLIFFIHSVIFFILIFVENPVKTLFVVEIRIKQFLYGHWRIWLKINETNIYKQIVQRSTTCPKVTKFTDIFWKLAANLQKV